MKIGDKVLFNQYVPFDLAKGGYGVDRARLIKTLGNKNVARAIFDSQLSNKERAAYRSTYVYYKEGNISTYTLPIVTEKKMFTGIYVGNIKRKLTRQYRVGEEDTRAIRLRAISPRTEPSRARHRIDNPYQKENISLINYNNKILMIPERMLAVNHESIKIL